MTDKPKKELTNEQKAKLMLVIKKISKEKGIDWNNMKEGDFDIILADLKIVFSKKNHCLKL